MMTIRPADIVTMANRALLWSTALVVGAVLTASPVSAREKQASGPVACSQLAADPALGLVGNKVIKSVNSTIIQATGPNRAHCQVNVLYGESLDQNINIRVGLPLNSLDGGTGGIQGAWNGRTQGVGGGGCAGGLGVTAPVNAGYVGSGTDTGHSGGDCEPGVNLDDTYNLQFIEDFIRNAIKQQVLLSKSIARTYYGVAPVYNYWNGCSTGGRQGYLLAQELGKELDGILANAPAIYWTRFQTAQMWGQVVMNEVLGAPIAAAKLTQATASAVAACDATDGVTDGVIDDPRTCHFSATANICGAPKAPVANCLTPAEADVIDRIWDGPRNTEGQRIWFGLDRGTNLASLNGTNPFAPAGRTSSAALVDWVENDVAPAQILGRTTSGAVTRPLCLYPQTAIYNGTGNRSDAASFHCGGDLETPEVVCADVLTKYEARGEGPAELQGLGQGRPCLLRRRPPALVAVGARARRPELRRRQLRGAADDRGLRSHARIGPPSGESRGLRPRGAVAGCHGVMYPGALSRARFGVVLGRFCSRRISRWLLRAFSRYAMRAAVWSRTHRPSGHDRHRIHSATRRRRS